MREVAKLKDAEVCPDGKDGVPAVERFSISGQVINGRGRFTVYFIGVATAADTRSAAPIQSPLFFKYCLGFLYNSKPNEATGARNVRGETLLAKTAVNLVFCGDSDSLILFKIL